MTRHSIEIHRQIRGIELLLSVGLLIAMTHDIAIAQDPIAVLEDSIVKIVEKSEPAVVSIARITPAQPQVIKDEHQPFPLEEHPKDVDVIPNEFGAGCLISQSNGSERLVLTNFHVVRGGPVYPDFGSTKSTKLLVHFSDRRSCRASIIAADPRSDLAVLRLKWDLAKIDPADMPCLDWESATSPRKGQFVILLGNPHAIARDGSASVSWGMISNLTRQPLPIERNSPVDPDELANGSMLYRLGAVMQLDARMNLGQSGGPVLNLKGEMIGISTSLAAIEGYEQSVGFALPIDSLTRRIIRTLLAGQEVEYGMLGIFPLEIAGTEFLNLNTGLPQQSAAKVGAVTRGTPAANVGIDVGDLIVSVEGQPVRSVSDLMRMVGLHSPEEKISVVVWRNGTQFVIPAIKLTKWPVRDDEGIIETSPRYAPWRGLSVDYATARHRFNESSNDSRRVLVTRVVPKSPADAARIEPGKFISRVNNIPVKTPAEFHAVVKNANGPVSLTLSERVPGLNPENVVVILEPSKVSELPNRE